jgi:PhnB protein
MPAINPYLIFNGNAEKAFNFYKSIFGGDFTAIMRFNEAPPDPKMSDSEGEKLMHVSLPIGNGTLLMGSDSPDSFGKVNIGNNFNIAIDTKSEDEANKIFNGLSEGGKVNMPMDKTFWGSYFGMLVDKFGIQWMVSYNYNQQQ